MSQQTATPAERISQAIKESGHSATEICNLTGISKPSMSCWMSGKYAPKGDALYKLGRALNVNEAWLAGYDVPKERMSEGADALADVIAMARKNPEFRLLLELASGLDPDQLKLLSQVAYQFRRAGKTPTAGAPDQ